MIPRYKDIVDLVKKGSTVEAQEKIMELRESALALQEENFELREKNAELEAALANKNSLKYEAPFYWKIEGEEKEGPFCQQCQDKDNKQIRLQTTGEDFWRCFTCNQVYYGPEYKEPDINNVFGDQGWP